MSLSSKTGLRALSITLLVCCLLLPQLVLGADSGSDSNSKPVISIPKHLDQTVKQEAATLKEKLLHEARHLFKREPLNFDLETLVEIRDWLLDLPTRIPEFIHEIIEESQLLGLVGSLILLGFFGALLYSFVGARKVLARLESFIAPLKGHMPDLYYPYVISFLKILAATIIPLLVFGLYSLVHELIDYEAPWFLLVGSLLQLWVLGALLLTFLHEALLPEHLPIPAEHARAIYKISRKVVIYALVTIGLLWAAEAFEVPNDVIAFLKFVVYLSIVFFGLLLLLKKKSIIAILPPLPYKIYRVFYSALRRFYYPAVLITFVTGVLWCVGYRALTEFIWIRTWGVAALFFIITVAYHNLDGLLARWIETKEPRDEVARALHRSLHAVLSFATITAALIIILDLLGVLDIIQVVISFPLVVIGSTPVSLWILAKASLIVVAFVFISRLLRAYLDYKVYPSIGVDEGLAYSINTLIGYVLIAIGLGAALRAVGLDFKVLMVFAGAVGIGIGLGMQSLAGNLISGLILIFGRKVRKGDWIQVGERLGYVQEVSLRATRVRTRDNIEYLIPNSDLTSTTIVNHTLSEPEIRVHIPVGVSYNASPQEVTQILLTVAERNPNIKKNLKPKVWFVEYGDSSINFELLVWIDVRQISEREIRSQLYFEIFEELAEAGIEIPFPQRDLHIRSGLPKPVDS